MWNIKGKNQRIRGKDLFVQKDCKTSLFFSKTNKIAE